MSKLNLWNDDYGNGFYEPEEPDENKLPTCCGKEMKRIDDDDDHGNEFNGFYCELCEQFKEDEL